MSLFGDINKMTIRKLSKLILSVVAIYIILGNLPRILSVPGFRDNLSIMEFIIYLSIILYALLTRKILFGLRNLGCIYIIIATSFMYGLILNGFEIKPFFYAIRLILGIFSANIAGFILYKLYRNNIISTINYILVMYVVILILSIIIYLAFPESALFWEYLSRYGIGFSGDPHVHRFVSTYLDPNYYAAIACIPLFLSIFLYGSTNKIHYLIISFLFIVSVFLSGSRSGIVTMVLLLAVILYKKVMMKRISIRSIFSFGIIFFLMFSFQQYYIENLTNAWNRLINIFTYAGDESALERYYSFQYGMNLFFDYPILGVGYNYLSSYTENFRGLSSLDSSIQATLVNFGIILTSLFIICFVMWIIITWKSIQHYKKINHHIVELYNYFLWYILIILIFTSQFNNLLYYQFWLFPNIMIGTYFFYFAKGVKSA
ncbi:MAG: hypothetical protein VR69_11910 [Peptococcaceae bacterium BRH_c4b]|nr:MAG: hypothetical protein VR69_11910 [Peptococcaceae bacterium BRH_c4b]